MTSTGNLFCWTICFVLHPTGVCTWHVDLEVRSSFRIGWLQLTLQTWKNASFMCALYIVSVFFFLSTGVCTSAESTEISAESHHGDAAQSGRLDFKTFNVKYLLKHAQPLLASARTSTEYDVPSLANDPTFAGLNRKEQAAR